MSGSGHGFLLWVRLGFSLKCHTIVTVQSQATKKNPREWQDYFCFLEIFLQSLPTMRSLHFETTPAEINNFLYTEKHSIGSAERWELLFR
jgi:hypothetical protein